MNFLNPFALLGLLAAGIPLLLHLLNLRKLRTVEFSSLRFLLELQQTQVRRLKLQQILLLILRTLIVVFAVLAFARPTIPANLPLLSTAARSSVVILVDNSASMEAADQRGVRLRQAQDAALSIANMLNDGDEVCVLPLAGRDPFASIGFTRTFAQAREDIESITLNNDRADVPGTLREVNNLLLDAAHAHREVFIISDAQRSTLLRKEGDTSSPLTNDAVVFLLRIGDGLAGLEQNLSVDSVHLVTLLPQPGKPVEVEAFVRNGSDHEAVGVLVSMAFDKVRTAQRALDIPAGGTRSVVLSAPIQRQGLAAISVELNNDAIDRDNVRYLGLTLPPQARVAVIGNGIGAELVATALGLPAATSAVGSVRRLATASQVAPFLNSTDVVFLVEGTLTSSDVSMLSQFVERGGGLVVFASDEQALGGLLQNAGLAPQGIRDAPPNAPWAIRQIDEKHPLLSGVFKDEAQRRVVETPRIKRLLVTSGGQAIASADVGPFLSEGVIGTGRVLFFSVGMDGSWGPFGGTGLFAATMVRSAVYLSTSRDQRLSAAVDEPVSVQVPTRFGGEPSFVVQDVSGIRNAATPARLPSGTILSVPGQRSPGVVKVSTPDSVPVTTISVNAPTHESQLNYFAAPEWEAEVSRLVRNPDHVVVADGRSVSEAVRAARTGSELWPLFIILAVACAIAESVVSRIGSRESATAVV